jgi:hypothetical protein
MCSRVKKIQLKYDTMTIIIMTLLIMTLLIMTLLIMTLLIMTLLKMTLLKMKILITPNIGAITYNDITLNTFSI